MKNYIVELGLIAVIIMLFVMSCNRINLQNENEQLTSLMEALQDSMTQERNKAGQWEAERSVLTGSIKQLKVLATSKDSTIARLSSQLSKKVPTAASHSTTTSGTAEAIIYDVDTLYLPDTTTRKYHHENQWHDFHITTKGVKAIIDYKINNQYDYSVLWNKKKTEATFRVVNMNPNTKTTEIIMLQTQNPRKKGGFWWGLAVGVGAAIGANAILQ